MNNRSTLTMLLAFVVGTAAGLLMCRVGHNRQRGTPPW